MHAVIGTSGLRDDDLAQIREAFDGSGANVVVAANFAIGAVLLMHCSRVIAPHMDGVEVIELHHDAKRDAPSGTALRTAALIAEARRAAGSAPSARIRRRTSCWPGPAGGGARRRARALGAPARAGGARGGHLRRRGPEPEHPPRLLRPHVVHAGRAAGRARGGRPARPDAGPRAAARAVNPEVRERLLRATYDCVARWGLDKTTVEDAAREAGVSRATVYRYFPGGRDELISAVVGWEFARFFLRLYEEVSDAETLEEVMERGLMFAHRAVVEHEVLQRILVTEPEILLPPHDDGGRPDAGARRRRSSRRTWCGTG